MSEQTIIGQMLIDNAIIPSLKIKAKHFTDNRCLEAFQEIVYQYDRHGGASKECLLDKGFDYDWVINTMNIIPTASNFPFFEEKILTVHRSSFERRIVEEASMILSGMTEGNVVEFLEREITAFSEQAGEYRNKRLKDVLMDGINDIEKRVHLKGDLPGITTGMPNLNGCLGGWQKRQYYIIGARPSDGKTAIGINFILEAAKAGKNVGFISAESGSEELGRRIYAREGRINATSISLGVLSPIDFDALTTVGERLEPCSVVFYDEPNPTIQTVERKAREWKRRDKIDVLFIDYVQYLTGGDGDNNHERIANISTRLKALARRLEMPVVAMAQLTRFPGERHPVASDVAGSDQITRDADGILLLHHDRDPETNKVTSSRIIVDKARDGQKGIIPVIFEGEFLNFREV